MRAKTKERKKEKERERVGKECDGKEEIASEVTKQRVEVQNEM